MHLQRQFNLVVIPLVIVPLLILGWLAYGYLLESERNKLVSIMHADITSLKQKINIEFSQAQSNIELLASDGIMTRYALIEDEYTRYNLYQKGLLSRFKSYQHAFPLYQEIRYILPDGYEDSHWSRADYNNITDEEELSPWHQELLKNPSEVLNTILLNPDTGNKSLYSFHPLILRNINIEDLNTPKKLRGYLATTMKIDWLKQQLESTLIDEDCYIVFSDQDNNVIYSFGNLKLSNERNTEGEVYQLQEKTIFGYKIVYKTLQSHAHSKANELATTILIITLSSIILTIIALITLLRFSVIQPLNKLAIASKDISAGHLTSKVDLHSCDELEDISQGFNGMINSLSENDEKIRYIAYHDSLTQLPNRRMFHYLLANTIASTDRHKDQMGLFFLDIDNFKTINDSLGHDIGDKLLILFSQRVAGCLREEDSMVQPDQEKQINDIENELIARLGGDEFTVVLPHLSKPADAAVIAQRIINSLQYDFQVEEHHFRITTSIGIAIYPSNGDTLEELIKHADIAMYHAKSQGKNNYQFYAEDLNEAISDRVERENDLRQAIELYQLEVYFQPQISLPDKNIYGFEALVRWIHPEKGMISPINFITLAEETGMIIELGDWVLKESCRIAKEWLDQGLLDFRISVNISSIQFKRQDVYQLISDSLKIFDLPAEYLTIELTESAIMSNQEDNLKTLSAIKKLGVKVSLDDFGTGYSSLSYLRSFPVDTLKIDRQFIIEAKKESEVRSIVSAIIQMAHALQLDVVAEGVEDEEQLKYLASINCDVIQGYYFSKPLPEMQALAFIKNNTLSLTSN